MNRVASLYIPDYEPFEEIVSLKSRLHKNKYEVFLFPMDTPVLYARIDGRLLIGSDEIEEYISRIENSANQ